MIEVEAPDGSIIEFPAGTPDATIDQVMRENFGGNQQAPAPSVDTPPTLGPSTSTPANVARSGYEKVWKDVQQAGRATRDFLLRDVPESIERTGRWIAEDPARAGRATQALLLDAWTAGARDELLAAGDTALGRGNFTQNLQARAGQTADVPLPFTGAVTGAAAIPMAPMMMGRGYVGAMAPGAAYGLNVTTTDPLEKAKSAAIGAATGGAMKAGGNLMARGINPSVDPRVQRVQEMGITPTPGQAMGPTAKRIEERLSSAPLLGDFIRNSYRRQLDQFSRAAVNEALRPIDFVLPRNIEAGRPLIQEATQALSQAYNDVIPAGSLVKYTNSFANELGEIVDEAKRYTTQTGQNYLEDFVDRVRRVSQETGGISGQETQQILSGLRAEQRSLSASATSWEDRKLLEAMDKLEEKFQGQLEKAVGPVNAERLANVNRAYANFKRIQRAASMVGAEEGQISPSQLQNAVRALDSSRDKAKFTRGDALMQDTSESAKSILQSKYPDSGTAGRMGDYIGGGAATYGLYNDPWLTAGIAGGLASLGIGGYSPFMQRQIATALTGRQGPSWQQAAEAVRQGMPALGLPAAATTVQGTR